jgi:hypothetical protein
LGSGSAHAATSRATSAFQPWPSKVLTSPSVAQRIAIASFLARLTCDANRPWELRQALENHIQYPKIAKIWNLIRYMQKNDNHPFPLAKSRVWYEWSKFFLRVCRSWVLYPPELIASMTWHASKYSILYDSLSHEWEARGFGVGF